MHAGNSCQRTPVKQKRPFPTHATKKPHNKCGATKAWHDKQKRSASRLPSPIQTILSALESHQINLNPVNSDRYSVISLGLLLLITDNCSLNTDLWFAGLACAGLTAGRELSARFCARTLPRRYLFSCGVDYTEARGGVNCFLRFMEREMKKRPFPAPHQSTSASRITALATLPLF